MDFEAETKTLLKRDETNTRHKRLLGIQTLQDDDDHDAWTT